MVRVSKTYSLGDDDGPTGLEAVRQNRDALETLAESDLRSARWARELLDALEDAEGST